MANPQPNKAAKAAAEFLAGGTTQSDVARKYGISRQAVNRAIVRLKKRLPTASKVPVMIEDAE